MKQISYTVAIAAAIDDRPSCFRFPRGNGVGAVLPFNNKGTPIEVGKGIILMEGSRVAILGYGSVVQLCVEAAGLLKLHKISITVADARFSCSKQAPLIRFHPRDGLFWILAEKKLNPSCIFI